MRAAWIGLAACLLAGSAALGLRSGPDPGVAEPGLVPVGLSLVVAQPFVLDVPYVHTWRAERPLLGAGWLLVLEGEARLFVRRQHAERVLYAGDQTAERVNNGDGSGRVVVLVPCEVDAAGLPALDLAQAPIWLGAPALPERVGAATIRAEEDAARAAGILPPSAAELAAALQAGGGTLYAHDRDEVELRAADLIAFHAPDEQDLVRGLRVR